MNRRSFLSLLGRAATGPAVVYSFPSIIVPKNIIPVVDSYLLAPRGLAYLNNYSSRTLQGLSTTSFPDLNSPVIDLGGAALSREMFESARKALNEMFWRTNEDSGLYQLSVL